MKQLCVAAAVCGLCLPLPSAADDSLYELESRKGDVTILYERKVRDFGEFARLRGEPAPDLDVVVTTFAKSPNAAEYEVAKAYTEALKQTFPGAHFTIGGEGKFASDYVIHVQASKGGRGREARGDGVRHARHGCAMYKHLRRCRAVPGERFPP